MQFIHNTLGLKILTPTGYKPFAGIAYMGDFPIYRLEFGNKKHLECTSNHRLFTTDGLIEIEDLQINQRVFTKNGKTTKIKQIINTNTIKPVYDIVESGEDKNYFTNSVLSKNCSFVSDSETLIDGIFLSQMKAKEPSYYTGVIRWYHELEANKQYLIGLDPSLGTGGNYASIEVYMLPEMIQIAEWQSNKCRAPLQVRTLLQILSYIEETVNEMPSQRGNVELFWTVENNSIGETILQIIEDTGEDKFPGSFVSEKKRKGQPKGKFRKGLNTNNSRKLAACSKLKSLIETERMKVNSKVLLKQLKYFISKESSFAAASGEFDDCVSATLLCVRMLSIIDMWGGNVADTKDDMNLDDYDAPMPMVF